MAKKETHDLKQTRMYFSVRGHLTKTGEDGFAKFNLKPKGFKDESGKAREFGFAKVGLNIKTSEDNVVYNLELSGNESNNVKYSYTLDGNYNSTEIQWPDRYNKKVIEAVIPKDLKYSLQFGKTIGLEHGTYKDKKTGEEKACINRKNVTGYDSVYEVKKAMDDGLLDDESSVYASGSVKPSNFAVGDEVKKAIKLEVSSFGFTSEPIAFSEMTEEDKTKAASFNNEIVIKEFNVLDGITYMTGIYVGYDDIVEMEYKFYDEEYAQAFRGVMEDYIKKGVYPKIRCTGYIAQERFEEEVEVETADDKLANLLDPQNKARKVNKGKTVTRWVIEGGDAATLDTETYTVEAVEKAKEICKASAIDNNHGKEIDELESTTTEEPDLSMLKGKLNQDIDLNDFGNDNDDDWDDC